MLCLTINVVPDWHICYSHRPGITERVLPHSVLAVPFASAERLSRAPFPPRRAPAAPFPSGAALLWLFSRLACGAVPCALFTFDPLCLLSVRVALPAFPPLPFLPPCAPAMMFPSGADIPLLFPVAWLVALFPVYDQFRAV